MGNGIQRLRIPSGNPKFGFRTNHALHVRFPLSLSEAEPDPKSAEPQYPGSCFPIQVQPYCRIGVKSNGPYPSFQSAWIHPTLR